MKLSSTSSLPSASCATCPGSRNVQGVEHTSATDAETSFPFVRCVAIAPVTMSRARVPSGAAAYKGRGATCCYPSCYEDLGEVCLRVICASQGATLDLEANRPHFGSVGAASSGPAEDRGAIHPLPLPCQVRFGNLVEAGGPNLWPPVLASSCGRNCLGHGGCYAVEAAAGPLDSATDLDQVQQVRVTEFREVDSLAVILTLRSVSTPMRRRNWRVEIFSQPPGLV